MKKNTLKQKQMSEALDQTLGRLKAGETFAQCMARYPDFADELIGLIEVWLELKCLPPPAALSHEIYTARRQQFLAASRQLKRPAPGIRAWLQRLAVHPPEAAARPVMRIRVRLVQVAFILAFTAYMTICLFSVTQASTPDTPLYGLKTAIEDTRLHWTTDPAQHASLALAFATERVREIMQLSDRGQAIQQTVVLRLQDQLRQATQDATRADEQDQQQIMGEVDDVTQQMQSALTQVKLRTPAPLMPAPTLQAQPSATLAPTPTATRLAISASAPSTAGVTPFPTQTPYRHKTRAEATATFTPLPPVRAATVVATPHPTGQPTTSAQQNAQPVQTPHPAAPPTHAPSHPAEPGPAHEGSPKRTTLNLPRGSAS